MNINEIRYHVDDPEQRFNMFLARYIELQAPTYAGRDTCWGSERVEIAELAMPELIRRYWAMQAVLAGASVSVNKLT